MARRLLAGALMAVVASLVGTGCGRLDLDILTEVFANGRGRMTLHVTASGIFTAVAAEAVSEARSDGYSPEYYCDAAGAHVIETVSFEYARSRSSLGEETERLLRRVRRPYKDSPSPLQDAPDVTITVDRHVFTTDYHFTQVLSPNAEMQKMDLCDSCEGKGTLPCPLCEGSGRDHCWACLGTGSEFSWYANTYLRCSRCGGTGTCACSFCEGTGRSRCSMCGGTGRPGEWQQAATDMAEAMFGARMRVRLPGKIREHNGKLVDPQTVAWELDFRTLRTGLRMHASSRQANLGRIVLAALLGLGLISGTTFLAVRSRGQGPFRASRATLPRKRKPRSMSSLPPVAVTQAPTTLAADDLADPTTKVAPELTPEEKLSAAALELRLGNAAMACDLLAEVVAAQPDNVTAWQQLGAALFEMGDFRGAVAAASHVVDLKPDAQAYCNLGVAQRKAGAFQEARRSQLRALRLSPGYPRAVAELRRIDEVQSGR